MKIDAVITWVDGEDPAHKAKRQKYGPQSLFKVNDIAGSTRYTSVGEIFWCVASLNRFAPWINRIFIVTDNQNPGLDEFMSQHFPECAIPMEIVDHKDIFRGYEDCLPTFSSVSIETMTWRIPGLSDCFIELNDDMMFVAPADPSDFFTEEGITVCYAEPYSMLWTKVTRMLKRKKYGHVPVTFKGLMYNAAHIAGCRNVFYKIDHTPRALRRDVYEDIFSGNDDLLLRNIRHRFRHAEQFSSEVLQYMILHNKGQCIRRPVNGNLFYLIPKNKPGYIDKKLSLLDSGEYRFCCFNSIDQAAPEDYDKIMKWISKRLDIEF